MMKRIFWILFSLSLLTASCRKFLEQPPYNNVSVEDIFKDFEGARTTLVGLYDKMKGNSYYQLLFYMYPEVTGGNVKYSRASNQALFFAYSFDRTELNNNELSPFYDQAYAIIYGANSVLENVDKATDATTPQKDRMRADALAIRAITHFDLARTFAQPYGFTSDAGHPGIVVKTRNSNVLTPTPARASVKQVYDQVLADMDSAIALYNRSVNIYPTGSPKTWLSADAVKAMKARVYLYKDDWTNAIALATELIGSNRYPLMTTNQYVASWSGKNISSESIFELAFGNSTSGGLGDYFNAASTLRQQFAATTDLLNLYSTGDVRGQNSMFTSRTINGSPFFFNRKYQGMSDSTNNIKVIRASELYLIRAEANAKAGNLTPALADLNVIRRRANPAAANFASTDPQVVINEILAERRRELSYEGHLFFDLARNKRNLLRMDCSVATCSFTYPNVLYAYPIPVVQ